MITNKEGDIIRNIPIFKKVAFKRKMICTYVILKPLNIFTQVLSIEIDFLLVREINIKT